VKESSSIEKGKKKRLGEGPDLLMGKTSEFKRGMAAKGRISFSRGGRLGGGGVSSRLDKPLRGAPGWPCVVMKGGPGKEKNHSKGWGGRNFLKPQQKVL